ncbi:MAG TPA: TetR/AcrR family transcriptional regulator [Acidimicrobiia bacterium]
MIHEAPVQRHPGGRRAEITRAAYRVMARSGVHRASLNMVAREAGVSKALLLYHFGTKDNLVLAALQWVLAATASRIRASMEGATDGRDAISRLLDAVWVGPEQNRDFFRFYLDGVEHQTRLANFEWLGATARETINGHYREVIEAGAAAGVFSVDDVAAAATQMRAVIEGMFLQWLQSVEWATNHDAYRDECRRAVLVLLRAA